MADGWDALMAAGAGFSGNAVPYGQLQIEQQKQDALRQLGQQFSTGQINQQQYLQGLAMGDPIAARQVAGVGLPAPMVLANEYQRRMQSGDTAGANALIQFAKTEDKGVGLTPQGTYAAKPGYAPAVANIEAAKAGAEEKAKKDVQLQMNPQIEGATTEATKTAELDVNRQANLAKAQSALNGLQSQSDLVVKNVNDALALIKKPYSAATGGARIFGGFGLAPNSDSRALDNYLNTIKANIGFDKLQSMRDNSPTGGALGQVSEFENKLLQAVNGALDPLQSDQLEANLKVIKEMYPKVMEEKKKAFDMDYGKYIPKNETQKPSPAQPAAASPAATPKRISFKDYQP